MQRDRKDFLTWSKVGDGWQELRILTSLEKGDYRLVGGRRPEDFDTLFQGHSSVADFPVAMYGTRPIPMQSLSSSVVLLLSHPWW